MPDPLRVLLVEANADDAELMLHELRQSGFAPEWRRVQSEAEYLAALAVEPALILADFNLAGFDCVRALELLQERALDIPFIAVSRSIAEERALDAMRAGAADYVRKDCLHRLGPSVLSALQRRAQRAAKRARAEQSLWESEEKFRTLVENSDDIVILTDLNGNQLFGNKAYYASLGLAAGTDVAKDRVDRVHPEDRLAMQIGLSELLARGANRSEYRIRHQDGRWLHRVARSDVIYDAAHEPASVLTVVHDVTERKRSRQNEARLIAILEATPDFVSTAGPDGRITYVNRAGRRMLGIGEAEDISGLSIEDMSPGWALEIVRTEGIPSALQNGAWAGETALLARGGHEIPVSQVILAHRAADGTLEYLSTISRDISEAKRYEAALKRRVDEFAALFETAGALTLDQDLHALLELIVTRARSLLGAHGAGIFLYEAAQNELVAAVTQNFPINARAHLKIGEGLAGRVAESHRLLIVDDYGSWPERLSVLADAAIAASVGVPMLYRGELIGVLVIDEVSPSTRKFTEADAHLLTLFAGQAAGVVHATRLLDATQRQLAYMHTLRKIDMAITSSFDLGQTLNIVLDEARSLLKVDSVDVLLLNPHTHLLEFKAGLGFRTTALQHTRLRLGEGYAGRSALERHMIGVPDLRQAPGALARSPQLPAEGFASYYAAPLSLQSDTGRSDEDFMAYYATPLTAKGRVTGVLEIFNRSPLDPDPQWLDFLEALAGQTAIAIDNSFLFNDLQRSSLELILAYDTTLEGWSRALELRDKETEGHTVRVTEIVLQLAQVMGLTGDELGHLRRGALLHDIGKMGVPDSILLKPGPLSADEWVIMRKHPKYAYDLLLPISFLRPALDVPYCHHEKWDGSGYPRGLRGEEIPLAARIFAIVDVWDALRSDRPYRRAWPEDNVRAHLASLSGTHLDPQVVDQFLKKEWQQSG